MIPFRCCGVPVTRIINPTIFTGISIALWFRRNVGGASCSCNNPSWHCFAHSDSIQLLRSVNVALVVDGGQRWWHGREILRINSWLCTWTAWHARVHMVMVPPAWPAHDLASVSPVALRKLHLVYSKHGWYISTTHCFSGGLHEQSRAI